MSQEQAVVRFELGVFRAAVDDGVVRRAAFDFTPHPEKRDSFGVYDVLAAYFDGDVGALDSLAVDAEGTPFQKEVWDQLRLIPVGTTISYGELARRVGRPGASRAVGSANGSNPIALIVPCHRVIRTGGAIGGYYFGLDCKRWLLAHESAELSLLHRDTRDDRRAHAVEDVVEAVSGNRQSMIA
jgi:O-6-methylguanine DNA methyltransferase